MPHIICDYERYISYYLSYHLSLIAVFISILNVIFYIILLLLNLHEHALYSHCSRIVIVKTLC